LGELGASFNQMTDQVERFVGDLKRSADENHELFLGTVKALAAAVEGKDPYTRGHSERVSRFSVATAQGLGLPQAEIEKIRVSALLHDVGKIGIDDSVLKKPSALTDAEFEIMKTHPQKGFKIMSQIPAMKEFLPGMYMHHEMINGEGYPQGLKGEEIPLQARVVSVADTFDAMTTERPYQRAMDLEAALTRLKSFVGTRYDARVVAAFIAACEAGKIRPGVTRVNRNKSESPSSPLESLLGNQPVSESIIAIS
jgi:HD-GYP domain-containing protein (c-di-GMP phosphodiesterase class II)